MGYIYIIRCTKTPKVYVGQTTDTLKERFNKHLSDARSFQRKIDDPTYTAGKKRYCTKLCRAMNKYGFENFSIEMLEEIDDDLLNETEPVYIEEVDSIKNGYNLQSGGDRPSHSADTRQIISERTKTGITNNITSYRKHNDDLNGLPKFCIYFNRNRKGRKGEQGVALNKHPLCKFKQFTINKYGNMEAAKDALIKFIADLEASGIPYVHK
jgi:group I intron endonuclease